MRRATAASAINEGTSGLILGSGDKSESSCPLSAMVEYSLGLDIPDHVLKQPALKAACDAVFDVSAWVNVCLYSFVRLLSLLTDFVQDICSFNVRCTLAPNGMVH
jgi:hypothetical protein